MLRPKQNFWCSIPKSNDLKLQELKFINKNRCWAPHGYMCELEHQMLEPNQSQQALKRLYYQWVDFEASSHDAKHGGHDNTKRLRVVDKRTTAQIVVSDFLNECMNTFKSCGSIGSLVDCNRLFFPFFLPLSMYFFKSSSKNSKTRYSFCSPWTTSTSLHVIR